MKTIKDLQENYKIGTIITCSFCRGRHEGQFEIIGDWYYDILTDLGYICLGKSVEDGHLVMIEDGAGKFTIGEGFETEEDLMKEFNYIKENQVNESDLHPGNMGEEVSAPTSI